MRAYSFVKCLISDFWNICIGNKGPLKNLRPEGYIIDKDNLSIPFCDHLIKKFEDNLDNSSIILWNDDLESDTRIYEMENLLTEKELKELDLEKNIRQIELYLGKKVKSWFLMMNRVVYQNGNKGSGGGLHRDSPISHQVKMIWYLTEVTTSNGPLIFVDRTPFDKTANPWKKYVGESRFVNFKLANIPGNVTELTATKGTKVTFDSSGLHMGKPISSGVRYAITLYTSFRPPKFREALNRTVGKIRK